MKSDLVSMLELTDDLPQILDLASNLKNIQTANERHEPLNDKSLAMIFEKPSTRTRVSFEVGMTQLGGHAQYLGTSDLQLGRGETIADTAKVLSGYVDAIMYRGFEHSKTVELARSATVPVLNGLDDLEHPCQIVADLFTIMEKKGDLGGLKLAYLGDGNNVCNSLLLGCAMSSMNVTAACPDGYRPDSGILMSAKEIGEGNNVSVEVTDSPENAAASADVIYTDVWVSMGDEAERAVRLEAFTPYQVNEGLVSRAKDDCLVMHCLPAHRGEEITDVVIDGDRSVVFDQAENRLHAQKALLVHLLG
ncbi:MAG: ornithine carbamoyltransferase [Candidatus Thorarchaeota archaeon]|jgi:ornithine carbamoyltransferase